MTKKMSLYKKSLLIFTIVLVILTCTFLIFVYGNLKKYENNLLENLLINTIHDLDSEELKSYLSDAGQSENLLTLFKEMVKRNDFEFLLQEENVYDAYLDERLLFTIKVKSLGEETCLGLLQYEKYEIVSITPHLENGLIYYNVIIPSNYVLYVNDVVYSEYTKEEEYADLDFMYYNDAMPKMLTYEINNLEKEATIEVEDFNGDKVLLTKEGINYTVNNYIEVSSYDEATNFIGNVDILDIAEKWSLFLSQDLQGGSYGFTTISNYVVEGSEMYTLAYNWAHNVDITFTSRHTLKNPPFTNERLENFVIYGANAFSCEVYLEKNMVVSGKEQTDVMHDYLYFIKVNDEWKLMNIKGI